MSSIIYNDDMEMFDPSYYEGSNVSEQVTDDSTPSANPWVNPIPVVDNTTRTDDGWTADTTATAGTPGTVYNDTPPTELQPRTYTTKTIKQKTRTIINDYSSEYLLSLYNQGCKFYVVYTDGTSEEIAYTDIVQPAVQQTGVVVNEAYAIAVATDQHFWDDTNGAHVTDVTKDDWATAVSANFSDLSDQNPYHNILINSLGILLRRALYNLVSISKSSIAFYDGLGNNANNILASYGRTGVQIGATDRKHLVMNENGVAVYNADGSLATFNAENIQTDHLAIGTIQSSISDISTIRSNANKVSDLSKSTLESLIAESSTIYISKATGTSSVAASTTKVTETRDLQNTWSLKRPTYDSDYPVVFVALQTVEADGSYLCSTPLKDDTLTVIDGGHITTGTIDAARIAVNQITVGSLQDGADYATKAAAMDSMQYVYKSAAANTTSVTGPTAWVTTTSDSQDTWTTTRPTYNASYPKLFVCKQTKKINNTVTSTTPVLDKATSDAISTAASDATSKANTAQTNAEATAANLYATKTAAVTGVQYIYISKASGTVSLTTPTTWLTEDRDLQNTWTTKRPTYDSQYPVTYIAKQTKTADNSVVTTTPMKDDTTTIIDGGHITTGTIDAARIAVNQITVGSLQDGADYSKKSEANANTQIAYRTKASSTTTLTAPTSWITETGDLQDTWTIKKPSYNASYPKLFVSIQTKTVSGTVTSTTPTTDMTAADAISTAASDATSKANAAAQTATNFITVIDDNGIKVHASANASTNYSRINADGLEVVKNSVSVAKFSDVTRLGKTAKGHIELGVNTNDYGYVDLYNNTYLLAHFGYDSGVNESGNNSNAPYYNLGGRKNSSTIGNYSIAEGYNTTASGYTSHGEGGLCTASGKCSHAEGYNTTASGNYAHSEGYSTEATNTYTHAEGYLSKSTGNGAHAEGEQTTASGKNAHAEGFGTEASANYSHAEGYNSKATRSSAHAEGYHTTASGNYSHAESYYTTASGDYSHAEGYYTTASGYYAHAEGLSTEASGYYSHATGCYTVASSDYQFACGVSNRAVSSALLMVGNGSTNGSNTKNALTVMYDGSAYINGTTSANGTAITSDARIKELIDVIDYRTAEDFIKQLKPKHYYKDGVEEYGFYAQDVEEISEFGDVLVSKDNSGLYDLPDYRLLNYQGIIAPTVAALQSALNRIDTLEKENKELKSQLDAIKTLIRTKLS